MKHPNAWSPTAQTARMTPLAQAAKVARAWAVCGLGLASAVAWAGTPVHRAVTCHVNYGGETQRIDVPATAAPHEVKAVEVGSYFLFRVVNTLGAHVQPQVKVYTYASHERGPAPVHQASYSAAQVRRGGAAGAGFTGLQWVYEPVRDGELTYWCEAAERHHPTAVRPPTPAGFAPLDHKPQPTPAWSATASTVRLVFAGDVMLDDGPGQTVAQGGDPLAAFDTRLRDADYTIGNLELPIATVGQPLESKIYSFRAHPRVLGVLKGRFDAMALANNHSGDYGQAAFLETMQHLDSAGIAHFGGGRHLAEAHRPLWIRQNGVKIAVLSYNEFKPRSFQAGPDWPGVAWSEDDRVVADIQAARRAGADVIIPFMHWGWERERQPTDRQRQLARLMIDAGADLVVGGHPHVTQGVDTYKGKLIVYSLGNFVFDSFENVPGGQTGWLLRLTLDKHGLLKWDTLTAQMDLAGTPHPVPGAWSPCGQATTAPAQTAQREARAKKLEAGQTQRGTSLAQCANP